MPSEEGRLWTAPRLVWELVIQPLSTLGRVAAGLSALVTVVLPLTAQVVGWYWSITLLLLFLLVLVLVTLHRLAAGPSEPRLPDFLEISEPLRYFVADPGKLVREVRYTFRIADISAWPEPRRLTFHCTGDIANPALWVNAKPSAPSQCWADSNSFRVELTPDSDKLADGVELFVLYYTWDPRVRIYKIDADSAVASRSATLQAGS